MMEKAYDRILSQQKIFERPLKTDLASSETTATLDERLLSAAMEVFLEKGFAAASVDEIAARARASKITFYKHYGNKEALFEAVVVRQNARIQETVWGSLPDDLSLETLLKTVATRMCSVLLNTDTVKLVRVLHGEAERFPKLGVIFDTAGPAKGMKMLAAELEKRMAAGQLRPVDPNLAAEQFLHLALGETTRRILLGLRPPATKAEITKRMTGAIDVFLRAYAP